jgi:hypothetical protein
MCTFNKKTAKSTFHIINSPNNPPDRYFAMINSQNRSPKHVLSFPTSKLVPKIPSSPSAIESPPPPHAGLLALPVLRLLHKRRRAPTPPARSPFRPPNQFQTAPRRRESSAAAAMEVGDLHKVWEVRELKRKPDAPAARALLDRIAKQVQPIMRRRKWRVKVLSEFS